MASNQLVHVTAGTVTWTPSGGAEVEIDVKSCTINPKAPIARVLGSKYGRQNISGTKDITGQLEIYLRKDEWPYTLGMVPGALGTLQMNHYDDAHSWEHGVILGEEFTEPIYSDDESGIKTITIPFSLDGDFPSYPTGG